MNRSPILIWAAIVAFGCVAPRAPEEAAASPDPDPSRCGGLRRWTLGEGYLLPGPESGPEARRMAVEAPTRGTINYVAAAAERYCLGTGAYPASWADLVSYGVRFPRRTLCAMHDPELYDSWDRALRYRLVDGQPQITSAGSDGRFDTPDDIGLPRADDPRSEPLDGVAYCELRDVSPPPAEPPSSVSMHYDAGLAPGPERGAAADATRDSWKCRR